MVLDGILDKLIRRDSQLSYLVDYIRTTQPEQLQGYPGRDVDLILRLLNHTSTTTNTSRTDSGRRATDVGAGAGASVVDAPDGGVPATRYLDNGSVHNYNFNIVDWHYVEHGEYDVLHEVAHGLHFASIAMLGFLVVEVRLCSLVCLAALPCRSRR